MAVGSGVAVAVTIGVAVGIRVGAGATVMVGTGIGAAVTVGVGSDVNKGVGVGAGVPVGCGINAVQADRTRSTVRANNRSLFILFIVTVTCSPRWWGNQGALYTCHYVIASEWSHPDGLISSIVFSYYSLSVLVKPGVRGVKCGNIVTSLRRTGSISSKAGLLGYYHRVGWASEFASLRKSVLGV